MGNYKKQIRGDNNNASELGSFNRVYVDVNGWPVGLFVMFIIILCSAAIIWMITQRGGLLTFLIQAAFIGFFLGAGIVGACFVARYVSRTRRQLNSDKAAEAWERIIHYTDSHIAVMDPRTQTITRIENGRDIQQIMHFNDRPVITEVAESLNTSNDLPPLSDLLR